MYKIVWKCMEIVTVFLSNFLRFLLYGKCMENLKEFYGKSMDMYGHAWKCMEKSKFVKIYGNVWKIHGNLMKNYGNVWKCIELYRKSMDMH